MEEKKSMHSLLPGKDFIRQMKVSLYRGTRDDYHAAATIIEGNKAWKKPAAEVLSGYDINYSSDLKDRNDADSSSDGGRAAALLRRSILEWLTACYIWSVDAFIYINISLMMMVTR